MGSSRVVVAAVAVLVAAAVAAGCGGAGGSTSPGTGASRTGAGDVTVTSGNFAESEILANMYADVLDKVGYRVTRRLNIGSREVYLKAMSAGEVDLVPEYVGTLTQVLNAEINGKDANTTNPLASSDLDQTLGNVRMLLDRKGLQAYAPSPAADQNAFAVTRRTAEQDGLRRLSDLIKVNDRYVLGGPPECQTRPQCMPGLERVYGVRFKGFKPLDAGGPITLNAISNGDVQIGLVFSSDGAVAAKRLVVLDDDKSLATVDNVLPVIRKDKSSPRIQQLLEGVGGRLTTAKLSDLNRRVGVDKADPAQVARDFLTGEGLL